MEVSTDGVLVYGFRLGGGDQEWELKGVDDFHDPDLPWLEDDFCDDAQDRLLIEAAADTDHVRLDCAGHLENSYYLIYTHWVDVSRAECKPLDLVDLVEMPHRERWDYQLKVALQVLGITPLQEKAAWLLAAKTG